MTAMETNHPIKTRFCPSPTGLMHLGNARTALFNALFAKKNQGVFLLRIEDTDKERSEDRYTQQLQEDLLWLNLPWQEGPGQEKEAGPYFQSQRQKIYDDFYLRLEEMKWVYPCFCSEEQLALTRKIQRSAGKPPRYPGTCRALSKAEIEKKIHEGLKPSLRFRVPNDQTIEFNDLVKGKQRFNTNDIGDFIIRRTNGTPPFMYCNAIDDSLMGVTHALRGEDHLTNTPRQIMILTALDLPIPNYGHIALIVGSDGSPLSKRHGSRSIKELREAGYLSGAVVNYLARLGHYYGHDRYLTLQELADEFNLEALSKSPAKFNLAQLNYWQKEAVLRLNLEQSWTWLGESIHSSVPAEFHEAFIELIKPNIVFPHEAKQWVDVLFSMHISIDEDSVKLLREAGPDYFKMALQAYDQFGPDVQAITKHLKDVLGIKGKRLYLPLRIALTGQEHGPELAKILKIMDHSIVRKRLELAL